ncbi:MAG: BadF/BadG/BcrA/BcrD ATPase family protein [Burkholderiaceae bacterium]
MVLTAPIAPRVVQRAPADQVHFVVGVDGGGTQTRARLADRSGKVLGEGHAGPSALGQGVAQAWRHISDAMRSAAQHAGLTHVEAAHCALGLGLSGANVAEQSSHFLSAQPGCALIVLDSDSFAGVLGAHAGLPGAVLVSGTGSISEALRRDGTRISAGGWGWSNGDEGSGAWLGKEAMRHAQRALDGREPPGTLVEAVWAIAGRDAETLLVWAASAGQFEYASLAPLVFEHEANDAVAHQLIVQAVEELEKLVTAIDPEAELPLTLCGSVALRLSARLSAQTRARCVAPKGDPTAGALWMAHRLLAQAQGIQE